MSSWQTSEVFSNDISVILLALKNESFPNITIELVTFVISSVVHNFSIQLEQPSSHSTLCSSAVERIPRTLCLVRAYLKTITRGQFIIRTRFLLFFDHEASSVRLLGRDSAKYEYIPCLYLIPYIYDPRVKLSGLLSLYAFSSRVITSLCVPDTSETSAEDLNDSNFFSYRVRPSLFCAFTERVTT